jgi:hypothetical protein
MDGVMGHELEKLIQLLAHSTCLIHAWLWDLIREIVVAIF